MTNKNIVLNPYEGMILITRSNFRVNMVLTTSSFPSSILPKQYREGMKVLLYNSNLDEFYAVATLESINKLTANEKSNLAINYPNAYDSSWKNNIILEDITLLEDKISLEKLNSISKKITHPYGYTLRNKGTIMYVDNYDIYEFKGIFPI